MSTQTAASVNPIDVVTAANAAGPDGTIILPPGKGVYGPGSNNFQFGGQTFIGAGRGKTIFEMRDMQNCIHHPKRMEHFSVEMYNSTEFINSGMPEFMLNDFDAKKMSGTGSLFMRACQPNDKTSLPPGGLIKNALIVDLRILGNGAGFDTASNGSGGTPYWQTPSRIGKAEGVLVIEDCDIQQERATSSWVLSALDSNNGFSFMVRRTKFLNTIIEAHDVQGDHRATRSTEVVDCIFDADVSALPAGQGYPMCMYIRGGTVIATGNQISPNFNEFIAFTNMRSYDASFLTRAPMFACNGSSPWDGNEPGQLGWPARDQIGRGRDLGAWPSKQESEPCYIWNNKRFDGSAFDKVVVWHADQMNGVKQWGAGADIKEGREYFFAPRPGWVPLAYPHPLASGVTPPPVDPPPVDPPTEPPTPPANTAPTIKFVKPSGTGASNELITNGKQISVKTQNIALEASDDVGPVRIELFINGSMVRANVNGEKTLTFPWNTAPHKKTSPVLEGVVTDAAGLVGTTGKVQVKIVW